VVLDSFVDGEIPEEAYPALVDEIQGSLGIMGHASTLAKTLTWTPATHGEDSRRLVVSVISKEGKTRIRVEERFEIRGFRRVFVAAGGLAGITLAAVMATFLGIGEGVPAVIIPLAGLGVASGVFGTIKFQANTRRPQLEALTSRLTALAEQVIKKLPGSKKELGPG
jgi:hypothetical protein